MSDDPGDIDRNGIPDAIQRDPVIVPEPASFGAPPEEGLPGITAPIEATAEPPLPPQPPAAPSPDADEETMARYQADAQIYARHMNAYSEAIKAIGQGLSNVARKE